MRTEESEVAMLRGLGVLSESLGLGRLAFQKKPPEARERVLPCLGVRAEGLRPALRLQA